MREVGRAVGRGGARRALVALGVGTALLAGCSEPQQAETSLPPATPSATPTEEALPPLGPADLPMPDEARARTPEGAQAFIEYYMEVYNHAQRSLDSTFLRDLSDGCETCERLADELTGVRADGRGYEGGEVRIDAISLPAVNGTEAQIALSTTQAPLSITMDGSPIDGLSFPERSSPSSGAILQWSTDDSSWQIIQWDVH